METEAQLSIFIMAGVLAMTTLALLLMAFFATYKKKMVQKELAQKEREQQRQIENFNAINQAEEQQKARIAANLHDEVIPVLSLAFRNLHQHLSRLESSGIELGGLKKELQSFEALSEHIRAVAHDLVPRQFITFGLLKSLESLLHKFNQSGPAFAEFTNETTFAGQIPLNHYSQLQVYRMCLEILNNLHKHARYEYLKLSLREMNSNMVLVFAHNGNGINNTEFENLLQAGGGIGLKSLKSRAQMLKARLDFATDKTVSYITISIPLHA